MADAIITPKQRLCRTCRQLSQQKRYGGRCACGAAIKRTSSACRSCARVLAVQTQGSFAERFWKRVDQTGDCWIWTGSLNDDGYGGLKRDGVVEKAHRVAYELAIGPIAAGLEIDHLCKTRACVRPEHLEAVTHRVNVLRGDGYYARAHRGEAGYNRQKVSI